MGCLKAIINDCTLREHTNQLDANFKDDETFRSSKHYKMMNTLSMARISNFTLANEGEFISINLQTVLESGKRVGLKGGFLTVGMVLFISAVMKYRC